MPQSKESYVRALVVTALTVATLSAYRWATKPDPARARQEAEGLAGRLDALSAYLRPSAASMATLDGAAGTSKDTFPTIPIPRPRIQSAPRVSQPRPADAASQPTYVLSAILITDRTKIAVINDSVVGEGSTLPG